MIDYNCFGNNYIGIRGECDGAEPLSGLYINDLPGVSLKLAANLADEETVKGVTLLRRLERQAIADVWNDLQSVISRNFTVNKVIDSRIIGSFPKLQHANFVTPGSGDLGITICKSDCDDYTTICINYITIRAAETVAGVQITVLDGGKATLYTVDTVANSEVRVNLNYRAESSEVQIFADTTNISLEKISSIKACGCLNDCGCGCDDLGCFSVNGYDNGDEVGSLFMKASVTCACDDGLLACQLVKSLGNLVQLKMGVLLMFELINSRRCNFFVANSKEQAEKMLMAWQGGINAAEGVEYKGDYWAMIDNTAQSLNTFFGNLCTKCVSCSGVKFVETIP